MVAVARSAEYDVEGLTCEHGNLGGDDAQHDLRDQEHREGALVAQDVRDQPAPWPGTIVDVFVGDGEFTVGHVATSSGLCGQHETLPRTRGYPCGELSGFGDAIKGYTNLELIFNSPLVL